MIRSKTKMRYFLILLLLPSIAAQCSVCGDGKKVSKPDEIFAYPGQPVVSCGALEKSGEAGIVPLDECGFLPGSIKDVCGCTPETQAIPPTRAPAKFSENTSDSVPESFVELVNEGVGEVLAELIGERVECGDTAFNLGNCFFNNREECSNCDMNHPIIGSESFEFAFIKEEMGKVCPEVEEFYKSCGCDICDEEKSADFRCHCGDSTDGDKETDEKDETDEMPLEQVVVGAKTFDIEWVIKQYNDENAMVGDTVKFDWEQGHNVRIHPSGNCRDDTGAIDLGGVPPVEYTFKETDVGKVTFVCGIQGHCPAGQIVNFMVAESVPTEAPAPTEAPTKASEQVVDDLPACPTVPDTACSVCGYGKMVDPAKRDNIFNYPGQPAIRCGLLETAGFAGSIPISSCPAIVTILAGDTQTEYGFDCGCMSCNCGDNQCGEISEAPIATTDAPVIPQTDPSVGLVTDSPIGLVTPTEAPISTAPIVTTNSPVVPPIVPLTDTPSTNAPVVSIPPPTTLISPTETKPTSPPNEVRVRLDIQFDDYPSEITWYFQQGDTIVDSGDGENVLPGDSLQWLTTELSPGEFSFQINDSGGDGLCCSHGSGKYSIIVESVSGDIELASSDGIFEDSETKTLSIEPIEDDGINIFLENLCSEKISVAIRYQNNKGEWESMCWYNMDPGQSYFPSNNGEKLSTENGLMYIYAESTSWTWKTGNTGLSNVNRSCRGTDLDMFAWNHIDANGDFNVNFTCDPSLINSSKKVIGGINGVKISVDISDFEREDEDDFEFESSDEEGSNGDYFELIEEDADDDPFDDNMDDILR